MSTGYQAFRSLIETPQMVGQARVERTIVSEDQAARWPYRLTPGPLTRLHIGSTLWMTDAFGDWLEHAEAIERATGRVLVNGLGLGCYVQAILAKPSVLYVTVVESNTDVIQLVGEQFRHDPRVTIVHGDARAGVKGYGNATFDVVWSDIWAAPEAGQEADRRWLHELYVGRARWIGSWRELYPQGLEEVPAWADL